MLMAAWSLFVLAKDHGHSHTDSASARDLLCFISCHSSHHRHK